MSIRSARHKQLINLLSRSEEEVISSQNRKLDSLLKHTGEMYVLFGSGILGRTALEGLRQTGNEPLAFVDNNSHLWGQKVNGVAILSPQDANRKFGQNVIFVITIYTSAPVHLQLKQMGVNYISFAELSWKYSGVFLPHYALDLPHSIFEQREAVMQAMDIWEDEKSEEEYLAQIAWRLSLDFSILPAPSNPDQMYFPSPLFSIGPADTIVDCGAFDGDTIRSLQSGNVDFRHLIAIEPDPFSCRKLGDYLLTLPENVRNKVAVRQNAVDSSRRTLQFGATGTARSGMGLGSYEVEAIPLDELLISEKPTYIKMDIEGAEYEALCGGREIIKEHRPILAICLYHRQEDLWRIPLLIRSMSGDYRLFLRRYSDECWEQVCYAIPKERLVA